MTVLNNNFTYIKYSIFFGWKKDNLVGKKTIWLEKRQFGLKKDILDVKKIFWLVMRFLVGKKFFGWEKDFLDGKKFYPYK